MSPVAQSSRMVHHNTQYTHANTTMFNGGGGDGRESSGGAGGSAPSANGHSSQQGQQPQQQQPQQQQPQQQQQQQEHQSQSAAAKRSPAQKDDKSSGLSYKDREERLRQLRERQQLEKQQKLEELKEQAAAAQRFREQQENERRRRLEEMRLRDADRRSQVEERKRIIQQAEQDRREAVIRKNAVGYHQMKLGPHKPFAIDNENKTLVMQEREHRLESKRRNERSNIVFAFGSSTPRMLDPKDNSTNASYWSSRRATSTTNVHLVDASITRRASECSDMDLSRKRATSAQSLDRKPEGEDLMTRSMTAAIPASAARRRTDLIPAMPSLRDSSGPNRSSPRHRSPVSVGATPSTTKPLRAKSAGSDRSAPATPARTPVKTSTPKKTPSQVKAESAAKKAVEKSKTTPKSKPTQKTPLQSPAVESKSLPGVKEDKKKAKDDKNLETKSEELKDITEGINIDESVSETPLGEKMNVADSQPEAVVTDVQEQTDKDAGAQIEHPSQDLQAQDKPPVEEPVSEIKQLIEESVKSIEPAVEEKEVLEIAVDQTSNTPAEDQNVMDESPDKIVPEENLSSSVIEGSSEKPVEDISEDQDKTLAQKAAEKPVTGYATEEEYKAALAEKRRLAREAKEREQELERQKQLEEEERERKEEEEFLKMIAEQKKAEEERLRKAIEEADRNRIEEAKRKEEEEKQREEAERLENQKRIETEERLRREEEERQARKSRVAAIMARTRGKGGSNTPTKAEAKTPSDETKNFGDGEMSASMTDSMISLVAASETQSEPKVDSQSATSTPGTQAELLSDVITKSPSDSYAPPTSEVSIKSVHDVDTASQSQTTEIVVDSKSSVEQEVMHSNIEVTSTTENYQVDDLISGMSSIKLEEPHVNGDSPVPMDTTPTQSVDLLGSLSDVHSVNHNGVDNTPPHTTQGTDNLLGSLDPLDSSLMSTTTITPAASNFEQIIDLGQTKLSNEDAVNSNPPSPFIAFEQNLNKKQNQENTSTVPDLLL